MISSGMHVSWSIFNGEFENQAWWANASIFEVVFVQIGFFVGSIVGGFNSGFFVDSLGRRKVIVSVCDVFVKINSVAEEIFVPRPTIRLANRSEFKSVVHLFVQQNFQSCRIVFHKIAPPNKAKIFQCKTNIYRESESLPNSSDQL